MRRTETVRQTKNMQTENREAETETHRHTHAETLWGVLAAGSVAATRTRNT